MSSMIKYKIRLPLELEQKANFNKHDFSSSDDVKFLYENNDFSIRGNEGEYSIELNEISATDRDECSKVVEKEISKILKLCSLIIQTQHSNQHYTHLRLNFDINKISFIEEAEIENPISNDNNIITITEKLNIHDSVSIQSVHSVKLELYDELEKYYDDKSFRFILDAYYRALNSTDVITKYFNAFSAIEFIETSFIEDITIHKLVSEDIINSMIQSVENKLDHDTFSRIKERIRNNLVNATFESRADKLLTIIVEVFNINKIESGMINKNIELLFVKEIIKLRNSLFHGKKIDERTMQKIRNKALELILLIQNILVKWNNIENN